MKTKFLQLSAVVLLLLFMGAGCQKDDIEIADESIEISSIPGISIYKPNNDYFDYISVKVTSNGELSGIPAYNLNDSRIVVNGKKISLNTRWRLKNGYVVDNETYFDEVFTDITIKEYVDYNSKNNVTCWPDNLIKKRIVDENPFKSFYFINGINQKEMKFTLGEISNMIENGTLETVFTKLK